jgi:aryl-alcohol dehydrogenase-like predicted oxidoreductase
MTFGSAEGTSAISKVDQKLAGELVAEALDAGVNFFNTADAYSAGQSELLLGKALGNRRAGVVVATKVGFRTGEALISAGLSRRHIIAAAEDSLRRLGTDYIDLYLAHLVDPYTPLEETLEALSFLVQQGKVRYVGFSNWPAWQAAKAIGLQREHGWARFRAAEMYYSPIGRELEYEVVPFALDAGIGIVVWSPLAGGFLSGKYTRADPTGSGGRLAELSVVPVDRERGYVVVERLREIGESYGATPAQVALAWILTRPGVTSVLVGASTLAQLRENLGASALQLNAAELSALTELTNPPAIYPNWYVENVRDEPVRAALGVD